MKFKYPASNPSPTVIPITDNGNNCGDDDYFPVLASESQGYTELDVTSNLLPSEATAPPHCVQGPVNNILVVKLGIEMKTIG